MLNFSKYNRIQKILFTEKKLSEWLIVLGNKALTMSFYPSLPNRSLAQDGLHTKKRGAEHKKTYFQ
ncbi:MAG: hypothetical protein CMI66_07980 [Pedosphaera sp.]|nr:hypothetical protein [Pedosphaera sp.]HAW00950.1 hypothetical protein [Verrucomicrobiales bacterium]|tara:strand:+ start:1388 stop:1585 length:198 start_codon:yes stop_codon:yes gene_type:complete